MKKIIYADNNATTPLHPKVKKTLIEAMEIYGNASSLHSFGRKARHEIEAARENVADFIGAKTGEVVFVGSGSEANNTVLNMLPCPAALCKSMCKTSRDLITSSIEHPCILESAKCIHEKGVNVVYSPVDEYGKVKIDELEKNLTEQVGLVSIMMANNEIGTIEDIKQIADIAHRKGILVHTDAVQALGKVSVDVNELGVDMLSLSAHKIYGPKGVGALYVKEGLMFCPFIRGGHQEKGRRAGTENTLGIIGFSKAVEMLRKEMKEDVEKVKYLRDKLKKGIEERIDNVIFNGHPTDLLPNTLNVSFEGAEGEAMLLYLDLEGIAVSTGSACASGSLDPSHVLLATGLDIEYAHGSIRFSFGRENTEKDVDYIMKVLPKVIQRVRDISTVEVGKR
ncbi:MAG: IscS subfamily cysteine desulfurase [Candidatus Omnitrophota bacterium]